MDKKNVGRIGKNTEWKRKKLGIDKWKINGYRKVEINRQIESERERENERVERRNKTRGKMINGKVKNTN